MFSMPDFPKVIILLLIIYVIILLVLKKKRIMHKISSSNYSNLCPLCKKEPLERIKKLQRDHFINYVTFQVFNFKRYKCIICKKSFLRWEKRFK